MRDLLNSDDNRIKQLPGVYDWHVCRWKLQAKFLLNNQSSVLKKPPNQSEFIYYDIETNIQQNLVWLIGIYNPNKDEFKQFLAKNTKDERKILEAFVKYQNGQACEKLCSYSGSWFDRRVIQKRLNHHAIRSSSFENSIEIDLGLEIQQTLIAKVQNYQLKSIGNFFNYKWTHKDEIDGFLVALRYEAYQRDKSICIDWNQLLEYNRDDVLVLPHILQGMGEIYERKYCEKSTRTPPTS
ncbi:MAG: ribonuclease H-like domain-containing protein [Euryarchaeota archaeon]|nr:ribonuclease H-like domain-containing protein [Euryarchaeota archaeon]